MTITPLDLKDHLLAAVNHVDQFGDSADNLVQLFTDVCLEFPDFYNITQQREALIGMGFENIAQVANFLSRIVRGDPDSADSYWRNRIYPFMKKAWPKSNEFITGEISENLALMMIELTEAFEEALDFLEPLLQPVTDLYRLLSGLKEKRLPDNQPRNMLRLMRAVFTEDSQCWDSTFRDILNRLIAAEPIIAEEPAYTAMDSYLMLKDL